MKLRLKHVAVMSTLVIGIATILTTVHWYYQRYVWPAQIQKELFGRQIADANVLSDRISEAAYGQGMFRWTYRIDPANSGLQELCGLATIKKCRFTRSKHSKKGVDLGASYADGILIVEEWWS
jgi:hypothetical protein